MSGDVQTDGTYGPQEIESLIDELERKKLIATITEGQETMVGLTAEGNSFVEERAGIAARIRSQFLASLESRAGELTSGNTDASKEVTTTASLFVEWMKLEGNSNAETSAAFLRQLRERHTGPLTVIWDNVPSHRGEVMRDYLRTPQLRLRLVPPRLHGGRLCRATARDFNADKAIWSWVRQEVTGNLCLGTRALVQERDTDFLAGLANRKNGVKRWCRTALQSRAEGLMRDSQLDSQRAANVHPTLALV